MTATKKRARELARAKEERRRAREAAQHAKKRRRRKSVAAVLAVGIILLATGGILLRYVFDDSGSSEVPVAEEPDAPAAAQAKAATAITDGEQVVASCQPPGELQATPLTFEGAGDAGLGGATSANLTLSTNCGDIVVAADAAAAPQTVNAMAFLANENYFDGTLCHRLTTENIFVLQCGDPTATGTGSPGFTTPDENLPEQQPNNYPAGTVAMANSGPNTSGSQFFIVYKDTTLPANYTVWGTVSSGLDIVSAVADAGTIDGGTDGAPKQAVMIQEAAVQAQ